MLNIIQQEPYFDEITLPDRNLLRIDNSVGICVIAFPKYLNSPPKNRQQIHVDVRFCFNEFMNPEPFEVASASCFFDIFTNRDVLLMELYRMVVSVAESLKAYVLSENIPYLQHEVFPLDPPDVVRAKLAHVLHKINHPLSDPLLN